MRHLGIVVPALMAVTIPAYGADRLAAARKLYNQELYELAIKAASDARQDASVADEAALIIARANLERFRQTRDGINLTAAREALRDIDATHLSPRAHPEFTLGLAEWLFLDDRFAAAAELFDAALGAKDLDPVARDRVLDWWATSVDLLAQVDPTHRAALYSRIVERMESELRSDPGSQAAGYWLPAALRSLGDVDRAWHTSIAGYLRARVGNDRGTALRADLDRLVLAAIIPERARNAAGPAGDVRPATETMTAEWEHLKSQWSTPP
jgi:hypothetical protein